MIVNFAIGDALKGGTEVGSRVRIAAAACLVSSGLFVGGVGGALAFADPAQNDGAHQRTGEDNGERGPDRGRPRDQKPDNQKQDGQKPDDGKPDDQKPDGRGEADDGERGDGEDGEDVSTPADPDPTKTTEVPPPREEEPGECEEKGDDDCGSGPPWWPFPWPWPWDPGPGEPPGPGGGGGGGGAIELPSGIPQLPPPMQLPAELLPLTEPAEPAEPFNAAPGAATELPLEPISLPMIVAPPAVLGGGGPPAAPREPLPAPPRGSGAESPAGRQPRPADMGSNVTMPPASYRVGYTDYLRTAGIPQVVALAGAGVAGMLVLTGAGGLVGYRQAKAGHAVRTGAPARFMN